MRTGSARASRSCTAVGLALWRFNVTFEDVVYIIVIQVNPNAGPGHQLSGWWYPGMNPNLVTPLIP
jgi:hypothetical protein